MRLKLKESLNPKGYLLKPDCDYLDLDSLFESADFEYYLSPRDADVCLPYDADCEVVDSHTIRINGSFVPGGGGYQGTVTAEVGFQDFRDNVVVIVESADLTETQDLIDQCFDLAK